MKDSSPQISYTASLCGEHLEAISFLYGQRLTLLLQADVTWKNISSFEERIEAHLDALVTGGDQALEVCRQHCLEGDPGELFVAVCVFCRQGRRDLFIDTLEQMNPEKQKALFDALKYELPSAWQGYVVSLLQSDDEKLCSLAAAVVGYRRIPAGRDLVQALPRFLSAPLIRAVGRLRERNAASLLLPALRHDDEAVCSAAALTLLRLGERQALDHCREIAGKKGWAVIPLALGGGKSAVPVVLEIARTEASPPDVLLALGLLGECSVVPFLLETLGGEHAEFAAQALNLLTGAELYERVFIPDEIDEDELFPDELEAYKKDGKVPAKADGTPYGEWVTRLSQNPQEWSEWWTQNGHVFQSGIRYRNGTPFSPASLLENLQHEKTPYKIRQLAYEELVIRYDVDFPFEADMRVVDQLRLLDDIARWVAANNVRFQSGQWYFAGKIAPEMVPS